jgi:hypothetical protein
LVVGVKRNGFNLKVENSLKDYLSYHVIEDKKLNQTMILKSNFINNSRDKFRNEVLEKRTYRTPGTPRFKVFRPDQDLERIDPELQGRYCSAV